MKNIVKPANIGFEADSNDFKVAKEQNLNERGSWYFRKFSIEERIAIGKKYLGRKASDKEALNFYKYYFCVPSCISLGDFAAALVIPGTRAMEWLLITAGFLTGTYTSIHPHLPRRRFIQRGYFWVRNVAHPSSKWKCLKIYITKRGVGPVLKKLRQFGYQIPDQVEYQIKHNMDLYEMESHHGPRFI
jgi:hypothetical protein